MWRRLFLCTVVQAVALLPCKGQQPFVPDCPNPSYPTPAPAKSLGIDAQCPLAGSGGEEANQNQAKNNFCASGTSQLMTIADFTQLQNSAATDSTIHFGDSGENKGPQVDRAPLQKLGEGKLVTLTGYLVYVNQEGKESVNCENQVAAQPVFHDIHIELADSATADKCSGVVVEMIPHHRPDVWTEPNVKKVETAKLQVRVTGQLLFDSSHFPCENGQARPGNPERISLWEIHPVYKFEVCGSATCTPAGWTPLDQWLKTKRARAIVVPTTSQP